MEEYLRHIAGKQTIHTETSNNGVRLLHPAERTNVLNGTEPKNIHTDRPCPNIKKKENKYKGHQNNRVVCTDSDHFLVVSAMMQKVITQPKAEARLKWINTDEEEDKGHTQM
ncbi:hypothetical protein Trydic_g3992 [Trypoxylus dichotomus]